MTSAYSSRIWSVFAPSTSPELGVQVISEQRSAPGAVDQDVSRLEHRTHYDGSVSHVTGIVNISAEEYEAMPSHFDGEWLRSNVPDVAESMDRFIDKIKEETHGEILGELEIVRIPLDLYRARNATNRQWLEARPSDHPFASSPVFLAGDSAIGSPYFQSISLGFECAKFFAGLIAERDLTLREMLDRYELHIYKQWLRVYMRSKMIKHNKDLFESLDDPLGAAGQAAHLLAERLSSGALSSLGISRSCTHRIFANRGRSSRERCYSTTRRAGNRPSPIAGPGITREPRVTGVYGRVAAGVRGR